MNHVSKKYQKLEKASETRNKDSKKKTRLEIKQRWYQYAPTRPNNKIQNQNKIPIIETKNSKIDTNNRNR